MMYRALRMRDAADRKCRDLLARAVLFHDPEWTRIIYELAETVAILYDCRARQMVRDLCNVVNTEVV